MRRAPSCARLVALLAGLAAPGVVRADGPPAAPEDGAPAARGRVDCDVRARAVWERLRRDDLDGAEALLRSPGCPRTDLERGRWLVLQAALLQARTFTTAARAALMRFAALSAAYPEDLALSEHLRRQLAPARAAPLTLRLDLLGGYTSNALAGLPVDPSTPGPRSPFVRADLTARLLLPPHGAVQPSVEGLLSGFALTGESSQPYSSGQVVARPGLLLGREGRVLLAYKLDLYLMNQPGAVLFSQAHRAEGEYAWRRLLLFAGAGWRRFHERDRTRFELDGGAGWTFTPNRRLRLVVAGTLRYQLADDVAHDVAGGTALVNARIGPDRGLALQTGATVGYDHYVSSGEARGLELYGLRGKRRDLLTTASATLWSPPWRGFRLGLGYDLARRDSNADRPRSFDYQEHRIGVRLRFAAQLDPSAPRAARPPGHAPLDYGIGASGGTMEEERIQDLLRQDEADRRGSCGCGR